MSTSHNSADYQRIYRESIQPIFAGHPQEPSLDDRNTFYLEMLARHGALQSGKHLVDLGAGLSIFGPMVRKLGMDVTLIDDFGGGGGVLYGQRPEEIKVLKLFQGQLGIKIITKNFVEEPIPLPDASVDVITCFHSLEHWHNSPKRLFREIYRILRPNGLLVLATPNAVNIRKRAYVLMGRNNFPVLHAWYDEGDPVYRGHVREPIIRDLQQMMEWNQFKVVGTYGRNFIGRKSKALASLPMPLVNAAAIVSEKLLRFFPSLCSDIHVVGQKQV
ncbi:MAG: putative S-adenosylmethionine-dependent methyltransferase [Pedosphaera sp.]|nr:putative S-adenosylmethionine-dependent methyltransferase [Pedosphaera sp.]